VLTSIPSDVLVLSSHVAIGQALVVALRSLGLNADRYIPGLDTHATTRVLVGPIADGSPEAKVTASLGGPTTIVIDERVSISGAQQLSADASIQEVLVALHKTTKSDRRLTITPRHAQILQYVAEGMSVHQAASQLGITSKTVNNHLGSVYRRLGVENLTQAVLRAIRFGLIDPSRTSEPTTGS
jgi:DNA-binding CsgD family transcriptional regulator